MKKLSEVSKIILPTVIKTGSQPAERQSSLIKDGGKGNMKALSSSPFLDKKRSSELLSCIASIPSILTKTKRKEVNGRNVCFAVPYIERDLTDLEKIALKISVSGATKKSIVKHLTVLSLRKPFYSKMTSEERALMTASFLEDLEGFSEYSIFKACEFLRNSEERFFPEHKLISLVKKFDKNTKGRFDVYKRFMK